MELSDIEKSTLKWLAAEIKKEGLADEVFLYGSACRNALDADSDIDLLVILPNRDWVVQKKICALCYQAELEAGRVFSTICLTRNQVNDSPLRESPFIKNVKKQSLLL